MYMRPADVKRDAQYVIDHLQGAHAEDCDVEALGDLPEECSCGIAVAIAYVQRLQSAAIDSIERGLPDF
jgi:hypothetical protein